MKRVVAALICLLPLLPMAGVCCQEARAESDGLLDLVFEVVTAPIDLLSHLSGEVPHAYRSRGVYPEQCVPVECWPRGPRDRTAHYSRTHHVTRTGAYRTSGAGGSYDAGPTRRISAPERSKPGTERASQPVLQSSPAGPREIVVKVETKPQSKSPREIVIRVEPGDANQPAGEPAIEVVTTQGRTAPEETVVKVETRPLPAPAKETVVRVEIKEEPAVETPKVPTPPQPVSRPAKPEKKEKKIRNFRGCAPYGGYYYRGPGLVR
ncbi:MAG: hypothetical protein RDU20_04190 [Desulfomonilaceae bacterium]|nr:hypothetical protein [Desulfomonilaceae bacterium]